MRYRDQIINKVEVLESSFKTLKRIVQRQEPVQAYMEELNKAEERLDEIKQYVKMEPTTANEVGGF
jgi:outer membrane murein-binding lipoprotein Lpp